MDCGASRLEGSAFTRAHDIVSRPMAIFLSADLICPPRKFFSRPAFASSILTKPQLTCAAPEPPPRIEASCPTAVQPLTARSQAMSKDTPSTAEASLVNGDSDDDKEEKKATAEEQRRENEKPAVAMPENHDENPDPLLKYKTVRMKLQGLKAPAKTLFQRLRSEWQNLNFRSPIKMSSGRR